MEFRALWALRGPNYWANYPVLEALVDLGDLHDRGSDEIAGFNERLKAWLPTLVEHRCNVGRRGGFFERLERGTYMAHILEHVALELQTLCGATVGFGRTRAADEERIYRVVIDFEEEEVGRAALWLGRRICLAAVHDEPLDVADELTKLRALHLDERLGPSSLAILGPARKRRIPVMRLNRASLVQLGHGHKARRVCTAETDRTSALAETIAQDKQLTRGLLRAVGVPVPIGRPVEDEQDAWRAAQQIGLPVVVKPQYGNHGRGVATNLSTRQQVAAAYRAAREESSHILVEQFAPGEDHRLLVVGDRLVAAARREPAHVVGDGRRSITELIAEVNRDPRRSDGHSTVLSFITLDAVALSVLAEQGVTPESVPPAGVKVLVRRNGNLSTGGTATDVTDLVHPSVAAQAVDAARVVGLDVAGVDVVACDIGLPLRQQRGMVVEVNAGPGLRMHVDPSLGRPRGVGEAIVELLFGADQNGRIPIIGVAGTSDTTEVCRRTAQLLSAGGMTVGVASRDGLRAGAESIDLAPGERFLDLGNPVLPPGGPPGANGQPPEILSHVVAGCPVSCQSDATRALLINPRIEAVVVEALPEVILTMGLGYDRGSVGVVTAIAEGPLADLPSAPGMRRLEDMEERVRVFAVVADAVLRSGALVLNADDPRVLALADNAHAEVILCSADPSHPRLAEHCRAGGRAVVADADAVELLSGPRRQRLPFAWGLSLSGGGHGAGTSLSVLASVAAVWATGMKPEDIRDRLSDGLAATSRH